MTRLISYKLYTTPTCVFCQALKDFLRERKIVFEEIDLAANLQAIAELAERTGLRAVPVSLIKLEKKGEEKEEVVVGFDQSRISQLLGL